MAGVTQPKADCGNAYHLLVGKKKAKIVRDKKEYVYILEGYDKHYKVGKAKRSVGARNKELETGRHDDLKLKFAIKTDDCAKLEAKLRKKYRHNNMQRERHKLSARDLANLKSEFSDDITHDLQ